MEKNKYEQLYTDVIPLYIKHKRFMDVAIRLTEPIEYWNGKYIIIGKYVNQGFVETFELGVPISVVLPASKFEGNWQYCATPGVDCIRNAEWADL